MSDALLFFVGIPVLLALIVVLGFAMANHPQTYEYSRMYQQCLADDSKKEYECYTMFRVRRR